MADSRVWQITPVANGAQLPPTSKNGETRLIRIPFDLSKVAGLPIVQTADAPTGAVADEQRPPIHSIIEVARIPANHELVSARIYTDAAVSGVYDVAILEGKPGDPLREDGSSSDDRAMDIELANNWSPNSAGGTELGARFQHTRDDDADKTVSVGLITRTAATADETANVILTLEIVRYNEIESLA